MGTSDLTLRPGDILRGRVLGIDESLDACFVDAGAHGKLTVPLAGLPDPAVGRLTPGAGVCVQVVAPKRGDQPARACASIELSGRTSVLVLDGTALMQGRTPATPTVFVSKKLSGVRRAELSSKVDAALADQSCGLPAMLEAVSGPVTIVLRTAADQTPWEEVLSSIVVQATEAAAFTVLASMDSSPALLMAEQTDADGDASIAMGAASAYGRAGSILDGRRVVLDCGGEVVFERAAGLWCASVMRGGEGDVGHAVLAVEGVAAIAEALVEYEPSGVVAVAFEGGLPADAFEAAIAELRRRLDGGGSRISGDSSLSVVLIAR